MRSRPNPFTVVATNPNADLYGASRMLLESVEGFLERGWRVVVCLPGSGPLVDEMLARGAEVRSVPSPVLRKTYLNPRGLLRLAGLTLRSVSPGARLLHEVRPDVMYVNTVIEPLWLVLGRSFRVPMVCHVHEGEASAAKWLRRAMAWPLFLARRLMVNSRFSVDALTDVAPRVADRCEVVYNGIAGPDHPRAPRFELNGAVRLLYVGRLAERKGVADAIDAVSSLRRQGVEARLDVVGDVFPGYEPVEKELRQRVADGDVANRVVFHGFDANVWSFLADADVLLVPSRFDEPFGNTAVEGVLAARPVIATQTSGLLEAIDGFRSAIKVPPAAPEEIARAVMRIVARWDEYRTHAIADALRAADRYAPDRYRARVEEIMQAVGRRHA